MAPRDLDRATINTAEAARSLQVSSAALKRWAAAGLIPSQRTKGGHRRFRAEDVRALVPPTAAGDDDASRAADLVLRAAGPLEVQSWLQAERRRRGSWWEVARVVRALSAELYRRRSSGALNGVQVEVALDQLRTAALRFAELAVKETGAVAVLRSVVELREWLGACGARPGRRPRTAQPAGTAEPGAAMAWSPALSTGNSVLDAHHRTIVEQVTRFAEAVRGADPAGGLRGLVDFMEDYTSVHFRVEEQLMRQSRYPEMNEHLWEHQCMARDLATHERAVEDSGRSRPALEQLARFLVGWLQDHVSGSDQRLGAYLRQAAPAAGPSPRR
jgi:hemerythrin